MVESIDSLLLKTGKTQTELNNIFWCLDKMYDDFTNYIEIYDFIKSEFDINTIVYIKQIYKFWLLNNFIPKYIEDCKYLDYNYIKDNYGLNDDEIYNIIISIDKNFNNETKFCCKEEVFEFMKRKYGIYNKKALRDIYKYWRKLIYDRLVIKSNDKNIQKVKKFKVNLFGKSVLLHVRDAVATDYIDAYRNLLHCYNKNKKFNIMIEANDGR